MRTVAQQDVAAGGLLAWIFRADDKQDGAGIDVTKQEAAPAISTAGRFTIGKLSEVGAVARRARSDRRACCRATISWTC